MNKEQECPVNQEQDIDEGEKVVGVPKCIKSSYSVERPR